MFFVVSLYFSFYCTNRGLHYRSSLNVTNCGFWLSITKFRSSYIVHWQRIEFHETLSNHSIASLKLAENLFACCRIFGLGQNSRFRIGRRLSDNNVCLAELPMYSLSKLIYTALHKQLIITSI